ncbi:RMD1 family protein [Desulfotomaculum defluvii]
MEFLAISVAHELNLNLIASHFGINKKFKWEETLILKDDDLKGILNHHHNKTIYLFHFGCLVFINLTKYDISDFYNYLRTIEPSLTQVDHHLKYSDSYKLELDPDKEKEVHHDYMRAPKLLDFYPQIISVVLARSVALDRIEDSVEKVSDEIEKIIEYLDKGKLNIDDNKLAKLSAKVLRYKYNIISYVMVLDKPDITWYKEAAEELFLKLADLFDLHERYENLRQKTENIMDITEVFTILGHANRGTKLEWMIIILIAFEIVISLAEKLL